MAGGLTQLLKSMTRVLQYVGFDSKAAPTVPREQEHSYEVPPPASPTPHEQIHEPERPRLERGHPKR